MATTQNRTKVQIPARTKFQTQTQIAHWGITIRFRLPTRGSLETLLHLPMRLCRLCRPLAGLVITSVTLTHKHPKTKFSNIVHYQCRLQWLDWS